MELESVDADGNGAYHDRIKDLVVFGAVWGADVREFPFEVYASRALGACFQRGDGYLWRVVRDIQR